MYLEVFKKYVHIEAANLIDKNTNIFTRIFFIFEYQRTYNFTLGQ